MTTHMNTHEDHNITSCAYKTHHALHQNRKYIYIFLDFLSYYCSHTFCKGKLNHRLASNFTKFVLHQ